MYARSKHRTPLANMSFDDVLDLTAIEYLSSCIRVCICIANFFTRACICSSIFVCSFPCFRYRTVLILSFRSYDSRVCSVFVSPLSIPIPPVPLRTRLIMPDVPREILRSPLCCDIYFAGLAITVSRTPTLINYRVQLVD